MTKRLYCTALPLLFALYGIALRTRVYASGRSLWYDEAAVAVNIVHRSYGGLLLPLSNDQGAPVGWLAAEKTSVAVFGNNEYALRLVPFASSVLAVLVFWWLARRYLPRYLVPVAVCFVAVSPALVSFGADAKQYSSDVLVGLLLLAASLPLLAEAPRPRSTVLWGALGAVAVWCSHPATFLLAGFSATILLTHALARRWRVVGTTVLGCLAWGGSFLADYAVSLRHLDRNDALLLYWHDGFAPTPLRLGRTIGWLGLMWRLLLRDPVGLTEVAVVSAVAVAGLAALVRRSRPSALLLVAPVPFFVAAAMLHKFPVRGRLLLVLVPFVLLLVCAAGAWFGETPRVWIALVPVVGLGALLYPPAKASVTVLRTPPSLEEFRPALRYVAAHRQPGDEVWINYPARMAMAYYGPKLGVPAYTAMRFSYTAGPCVPPPGATPAAAHRVWIVLSHASLTDAQYDGAGYLTRSGDVGREVATYAATGVRVRLVAFSSDATAPAVTGPASGHCFGVAPLDPARYPLAGT